MCEIVFIQHFYKLKIIDISDTAGTINLFIYVQWTDLDPQEATPTDSWSARWVAVKLAHNDTVLYLPAG